MQQGFDDSGITEQGHGGFGSSGASAVMNGGGREHFGDTSGFSTTLMSKDGRFLGIKLSPELASQMNFFFNTSLDWVRKKAEKHGVPVVEKFATKFVDFKPAELTKFRDRAATTIGYGVILSNQLASIGTNIYASMHSLSELRSAVRPLENSAGGAALSGNNEVVANARAKINGLFWHRLSNTVADAIGTAPALMSKWNEQKAKNETSKMVRDFASAQNSDDVAKLYEKKVTPGAAVADADAVKMAGGREMFIARKRAEYEHEMAEFVSKNKAAIEARYKKTLDEISPENIRGKIEELQGLGINAWEVKNALQSRRGNAEQQAQHMKAVVDNIRSDAMANIAYYAEEHARGEFVGMRGAFDQRHTKYLDHSGRHSQTISGMLNSKIDELHAAHRNAQNEPADPNGVGVAAASLGATFVAEITKNAIGGKGLEKYEQPVALDMILHMRRVLEKSGDSPPDMMPGMNNSKYHNHEMSYAQFVHKIFQEHQQDSRFTQIGNRFVEHLREARWDDAAIQATPDDQLNPYEFAVKTISKRIKDGRMDAIALVGLVGDKQKKIVRDDGRNFGPRGAGKDDKAQKAAILKIIDEQTIMLHAAQKQTDEQVHEKLGNLVFSVEDIKTALTSKTIDPQERSFIFTVFSNVIGDDAQLSNMVGLTADQTKALRAETTANFNQLLDGAVNVLADMIDTDPAILDKKVKLTAAEKDMIRGLAGRMQEEGKDVADLAANREEIKMLETAVVNAAMALDKNASGHVESGKPDSFWQKVVAATKKPKQSIMKSTSDVSAQEREDSRRAADMDVQETVSRS